MKIALAIIAICAIIGFFIGLSGQNSQNSSSELDPLQGAAAGGCFGVTIVFNLIMAVLPFLLGFLILSSC